MRVKLIILFVIVLCGAFLLFYPLANRWFNSSQENPNNTERTDSIARPINQPTSHIDSNKRKSLTEELKEIELLRKQSLSTPSNSLATELLFDPNSLDPGEYGLPYMDVGYSLNTRYSDARKDSAKQFIDSLDLYMPGFTIYQLTELDENFYRLSYKELQSKLSEALMFNGPLFDELGYFNQITPWLPYLKENNTSYPYYQIWDEQFAFAYTYHSRKINLDSGHKYPIPSYMNDIRFEYDSVSYVQPLVSNYENILNRILAESNEDNKIRLLFLYSMFLYNNSATGHSVYTIDVLVKEAKNSKKLDNLTKAAWIVAGAKFLATIDPYEYAKSIYPYFRLAQGLLEREPKNNEYLKRLEIIRGLWWNSLPGYHGKSNLGLILNIQNSRNPNNVNGPELYRLLTIAAYNNLSIASEDYLRGIPSKHLLIIHAATELLAAREILRVSRDRFNNKDYIKTEQLWQNCLATYCFLNQKYKEAVEAQITLISLTFGSPNYDEKFNLDNLINNLIRFQILAGDTIGAREWLQMAYPDFVWDSLTINEFSIPDYRTLTPDWYNNHREELLAFSATELWEDKNWATTKYDQLMSTRLILKEAAKNEEKLGNWKEAFLFLNKADSLSYHFNPGFFMDVQSGGDWSLFEPEKESLLDSLSRLRTSIKFLEAVQVGLMHKNENLKDSNVLLAISNSTLNSEIDRKKSLINKLDSILEGKEQLLLDEQANRKFQEELAQSRKFINYMAFGFIGCLLLLFFLLVKNWVKRMMLSQTNNQLSHFAKNIPDIIGQRLRNAILMKNYEAIENELRKLTKLGGFFEKFYEKSENEKNSLKEELDIFKKLTNIEYNDQNNPEYVDEKIIVNVDSAIADVKIPTFAVFNLLYNSFKWGGINSVPDGHVRVMVQRRFFHYRITILDNGFGLVPNEVYKKSTGTKYVRFRIRFWNLWVLPQIYHGNRRDKQTGYEVSFSLIG